MSHLTGDPLEDFTVAEARAELQSIRDDQKALRGVPDGHVGRTAIQLKNARADLERQYEVWKGRLRGALRRAGLPARTGSRWLG